MGTQKKIVSTLVLLGSVFCLFLYYLIFTSSLQFEKNKTLLSQALSGKSSGKLSSIELPSPDVYWFQKVFTSNSSEIEFFLRSKLLDSSSLSSNNTEELRKLYYSLLDVKPTWPYYLSGILQLSMVDGSSDKKLIESAIGNGPHEKKVIKSLAEVLFYHWDNLKIDERNSLLNYLSSQTEAVIGGTVLISAKFARIYEYCDFLYDKKHVEYAACKKQFWQPLSKVE